MAGFLFFSAVVSLISYHTCLPASVISLFIGCLTLASDLAGTRREPAGGPDPVPSVSTPARCSRTPSPGAVSRRPRTRPARRPAGEEQAVASSVADAIVALLKSSGVRRVYGVPGDSLNGLTDALRRDGGITWEHVRHEEAAGFAAGAEAALTGELAVCAGSCGPGQPAPDQRPVRRQPEPGAGAGGRSAHPAGWDRLAVLPGDASAGAVPRVQRVLRAGQHPRADPARHGERDARGAGARRGRGRPAWTR